MVRALIDPNEMRDVPSQDVARRMMMLGFAGLPPYIVATSTTTGSVMYVVAIVVMLLLMIPMMAHISTMMHRASDWYHTRPYRDDSR